MTISQPKYLPALALFTGILVKLLFLLTHHIQEDAFITWRVAQNLLDYGIIGFNGDEKISASTTHLYVFVSYIFNFIFGKEHFITPLLFFNTILFSIGSWFLSLLFLKNNTHRAVFILLFNLLPPSIKASVLGMEYGLLFFLEMALLYFGFKKEKNWALIFLPILIVFCRIDSLIFLGTIFWVDVFYRKKIRWNFVLGGILAVACTLAFNYFYFNEWVNNTIVAKKLRYDTGFSPSQHWDYFYLNYGNFWGMIKLPTAFNPITAIIAVFELVCFVFLIRQSHHRNYFLWMIFLFAWIKQILFMSQKSLFDWYYWIPQILLFVPILLFVIEQKRRKFLCMSLLVIFYIVPMLVYQTIHSIATGNGEWNYRRSIGIFLNHYEKDKKQWILLEPAGYVPYFSGLKTIDEVGLVDKDIQKEIQSDRKNYWINTVKKRQPKYLLSYENLFLSENADFYKQNYRLLKEFRINNYLKNDTKILEKIYQLKPSGTDYNLYIKK